jgi:hypothetical protein
MLKILGETLPSKQWEVAGELKRLKLPLTMKERNSVSTNSYAQTKAVKMKRH